ncbi:cupin domain-containing protein [Nitrosopumilus sp. K4]|uniref:cupin domain-containing protein n=1 Tax=Nitrosopumilus sp. K4 TaxID=2795383 RepID=UPI001BA81686|nr:cupin domain-containing protein [Nitrosopumilus sp. K4]QUC65190.1 cupin domain-containing protein [Nitrosopumilus sp. K4]
MHVRKNSEIQPIKGSEGTTVKQFFHPHNTQNGINYSIAQFSLESGRKTLKHKLKSSEIYYILEGHAKIEINLESFELRKDDSAYVPPEAEQQIENLGDEVLKFLCIVEPAWKVEDEIILE